jgi:membrane-bound lytic murein transglycosylase D
MKIAGSGIILILVLFFITASDPFYGTELSFTPPSKDISGSVTERTWMSTESFRKFLEDQDNRVSSDFKVRKYFYPTVHFWFLIYTQFTSSSVVLHDKNNLSLIYKVLDFSSLTKKNISSNTHFVLQQKITEEKILTLKNDLNLLSREPFSLTPASKKIYRILKNAGIEPPLIKKDRMQFFERLRDNIRSQTGQKNFILEGISRSLPYRNFLKEHFKQRGLPQELLAIPFLESSFNPRAQSKVSALGIWQFMPLTSSYYVPRRTHHFDYRFNVGIASVAAASLMAENIFLMKSWDLAVTAYNSGTRHLLKTKKKLGNKNISLEDVIKISESQHFGFASKNFYSEFLALAHALAYQDELFRDLPPSVRTDINAPLRFFLSKCSFNLQKNLSKNELVDVLFHNHHTSEELGKIPRGFILTAKSRLPKSKFFEISNGDLIRTKPKDWVTLLRNQSCSTR